MQNNLFSDLIDTIEQRKPKYGGNPETSYVAKLFSKGSDAVLKKIGEEATEVVMAAKDLAGQGDRQKLIDEMADLWFHCLVVLSYYEVHPHEVFTELERRKNQSGLDEKARRLMDRQ